METSEGLPDSDDNKDIVMSFGGDASGLIKCQLFVLKLKKKESWQGSNDSTPLLRFMIRS